jgi:alanine racemase
MSEIATQRAVAIVDRGAIGRNCSRLAAELRQGTRLCAVVKANGYGHGALASAEAAVAGGATWLGVAAASEAAELRPRFPEVPILTMGAMTRVELDVALGAGSEVAVWRERFARLVAKRAVELGVRPRVHVKYDSGMGRLGERDPDAVLALARHVAADDHLELAGFWTHFATADELDSAFFGEQLERFAELAERVRAEHPQVLFHAANSAATLRDPASHFDMVRCGIAVYGLDPFQADPFERRLEPALELRSYVADVKRFPQGESAGYGRRWRAPRDTWVGVLPIGYGDGVSRALSNNGEVLVAGRRHPVVGMVSMDNVTIDLGPKTDVEPGASAVVIGAQGDDRILCEEVARRLGTINYEVTCGIAPRVPRAYVGSPRVATGART